MPIVTKNHVSAGIYFLHFKPASDTPCHCPMCFMVVPCPRGKTLICLFGEYFTIITKLLSRKLSIELYRNSVFFRKKGKSSSFAKAMHTVFFHKNHIHFVYHHAGGGGGGGGGGGQEKWRWVSR